MAEAAPGAVPADPIPVPPIEEIPEPAPPVQPPPQMTFQEYLEWLRQQAGQQDPPPGP